MNKYEGIKQDLNNVGCGFCLAKWTQVTIHLNDGTTHSCHHPSPHKIPLREIENSPSALHNTRYKKRIRKQMLEGKRPKECDYCWGIEDNSGSLSDRVFKSAEPWSLPFINEIKDSYWSDDYNPTYVEVSFSDKCNFKCAYCGPQFSSRWKNEINKHGSYPTSTSFNGINSENVLKDLEPYVEAFWEWWPELYKTLHTFRITGGEPLLSKDTFKTLKYIQEHHDENPELSLSINTNLGVSDSIINEFIEIAKDLCDNDKVRELIIFTSVESTNERAEYVRYGLDYGKFWANIDKILTELPKVTINLMGTYNVLSVHSYDELIDKVFEMKKKHLNNERYWVSPIQLDTSYLRWPPHLSIKILPDEHKEKILDSAKKMLYYGIKDFTHDNYGFSTVEIQKIKRTYDYAIGTDEFDVKQNREDFISFVDEYDKRRGVDFKRTFPELIEFYDNIRKG